MKKSIRFLLITSSIFFFSSCKTDGISPGKLSPKLSLEVEQSNSPTEYTSTVKNVSLLDKSARWSENSVTGNIQLIREINLDLELENGENLTLGFWFIKREVDKSSLILIEEDQANMGKIWDYKSSDLEATDFYQGFDEARIMVNNTVIFHKETSENFQIYKVKTVKVDGEEKSQLTIKFDGGIAYGWYDPLGEFQEFYTLRNGVFKGVIE